MEQPRMQHSAGVFMFEWDDPCISVKISRIREKSDSTSGEVSIESTYPEDEGPIHQARLNLSSTTSRNSLIKYLASSWKDIDWREIVDVICVETLRVYREGEPLQDLTNLEARPDEGYRVNPLLLEGKPTIIYGYGASGKSMIAAYLSVLVASGYVNGSDLLLPRRGRVLYLDYETDAYEIRDRVMGIARALGIGGELAIDYRRCYQILSDEIETIQQICLERAISLVVIDSIGLAAGTSDPGNPEASIRYFRALRSLGVTTLSLDHLSKDADGLNPFGSIYKTNMARSMWHVEKKGVHSKGNLLSSRCIHRKSNGTELKAPLNFKFRFEGEQIYTETTQGEAPLEGMSMNELVREALDGQFKTVAQLVIELKAPESTIRAVLHKAKEDFIKDGRYFTLYKEELPPRPGLL